MKNYLLTLLCICTMSYAVDTDENTRKTNIEKATQKQMELEKKYAEEQRFYRAGEYDFKSLEVDKDSLSTVPELEVDDLDMDNVYD